MLRRRSSTTDPEPPLATVNPIHNAMPVTVHPSNRSQPATLGRCVVCLKTVQSDEHHLKAYHDGRFYLVCCASCKAKFWVNPQDYVLD